MSGRNGLTWVLVVALACAIGFMGPRGESPGAPVARAEAGQSRQDDGGSVLPRPPAPFRGRIDLRAKDSKSDFPRSGAGPRGGPERPAGPARRRRLRGVEHLRRAVPHPDRWSDWPGAACATIASTRRPCARPRAPRCSPAGTITRSTRPASWRGGRGSPATTRSWARTRRPSPRS